jgi:hypothetical protein
MSAEQMLTTGTLSVAPPITKTGKGSKGFVVTGDGNFISSGSSLESMFIFDTDGDLVWAHKGPKALGRVRLDWDAQYVWGVAVNQSSGLPARTDRVSVDGEEVEADIPALARASHDFTVLPNGHVAVISLSADDSIPASSRPCAQILDYDPVAKLATPIVADVSTLLSGQVCHPNALTYQAQTNTFIFSALDTNAYVKFSALDGKPIWQFGGKMPGAKQLLGSGQDWTQSHGHHLTPEGRFVFFNNQGPKSGESAIREFQIDEVAGTATAGPVLSDMLFSGYLGDVQVLKNGNLWVTYSSQATHREYDKSGKQLVEYKVIGGGYTYFMESLYDKPVNK